MTPSPESVVREFWRLMATNDFAAVGAVLADEFTLDWPQSGERVRGASNFARINSEYPAHGPWQFFVERLVADGQNVVTDVAVSDGAAQARVISFFTIAAGRIVRIVEFWPEPYDPATDRRHLVERLEQAP